MQEKTMIPDAQFHPGHARLSTARARLCALFSQMTEEQVEAWLPAVELFMRGLRAQVATAAPEEHGSAAVSAVPSPVVPSASPGTATMAPSGGRPTYTVAEAAHLLRMKETTLRERIRMGRVHVLRLGHRVLVKAEELERLLAAREARPRR
jgi:excisionase family DNA binding protein